MIKGIHEKIFDKLDELIFGCDDAGRIIYVNEAFTKLFNLSSTETQGKLLSNFADKYPILGNWHELTGKLINREYVSLTEKQMFVTGGIAKTLELSLHVVEDENKKISGIAGIARDISTQEINPSAILKAKEKMEKRIALYDASNQVAKIGYYILDIPQQKWLSSKILDETFGIGSDYDRSISGWLQIVHPDDRASVRDYFFNRVLIRHHPFDLQYRIIRKDKNEVRWVHGLGTLEFSPSGTLLKMFGTIQDITTGKSVETDLIHAKEEAELKASQHQETGEKLRLKLNHILSPATDPLHLKLADIFEIHQLQEIQDALAHATGIASVITDLDGKPVTKPSNFREVCQLIRDTETGLKKCMVSDSNIGLQAIKNQKPFISRCGSCGFVDAGAPIFIDNNPIAIWMIGQGNTGDVLKNDIALYAKEIGADTEKLTAAFERMSNMTYAQFESVANLLWVLARELSNVAYSNYLLARKIGEQKRIELELSQAKEKAEESDRLKTAFLHNMSHEVRTPLNAIAGFTKLLLLPETDADEAAQYADIIQKSTKKLIQIVTNVIEIAQIQAGQTRLYFENFDLDELIWSTLKAAGENYDLQNVETSFDIRIAKEDRWVNADKSKLSAIIYQLVDNAFKFTRSGSIAVKAAFKDAKLELCVEDTGPGISDAMHEKILEPFIQAFDAKRLLYGGNGLGLSIANAYIGLMQGSIHFEKNRKTGTGISVTIPGLKTE